MNEEEKIVNKIKEMDKKTLERGIEYLDGELERMSKYIQELMDAKIRLKEMYKKRWDEDLKKIGEGDMNGKK